MILSYQTINWQLFAARDRVGFVPEKSLDRFASGHPNGQTFFWRTHEWLHVLVMPSRLRASSIFQLRQLLFIRL